MTAKKGTQLAAPLIALAGATALTALIVLSAPEVGMVTLSAMIAAWVALGVVRLAILLGIARRLYQRFRPAPAS